MSYEIDGVRLVDDVGNVYDIEEWLDLHGYVELPRDANGITDELRAWWVHKYPVIDEELHKDFTAIVNRIDAEHEKACDDAWDNGYEADYVGIEKWLTEHPQAMEHHGWVRLPVDADGVPICVGNEVETIQGKRDEVRFMTINGAGWLINEAGWLPTHLRRYAIDTWERIIRDAFNAGLIGETFDMSEAIARCKALAGDDK